MDTTEAISTEKPINSASPIERLVRLELVHYGSLEFKKELVLPVTNSPRRNKPKGGLWTSPVGPCFGWKDWCEAESYGDTCKCFNLEFVGSLLRIDSVEDMLRLPWEGEDMFPWIDFERLAGKYDAIHLTENGENDTRFTNPKSLYGWDCETVFVMNKDCLKAI